ncbi:sugar transferase [Campylobacter lari]|uniref:sugar transferase n=3 Tax=Campylobacter lari TaxID=201 RepID=UPI000E1521A3|nr:sugar transferase [Campylobacter lari]QKF74866.1 alpha-1,2-fucosyltransferase [Campylobacter lari subsp. lari]QQT72303.1 hypothetical protein I6I58_02480 [Campylobacter lari]TXE69070.1 sugar transferase [Campylobacter lari]SUX07044.1 putative sugar transferase [Campylobacter lari]
MSMIIANRTDGTGSRLISLMNAMYLAKILNKQVKFTWKNYIPFTKDSDTNNFRKVENDNVSILGLCVESHTEIFSKNFIDKYFLESINGSIFRIDGKVYTNFDFFLKELKVNKYDYISVPLSDLSTRVFKDIDDLEYRKYMQNIWKDIEFSESVKKIVNMAKQTCMKFKDFICIHIRSGDAIYDYAEFRKFNLQSIYHATPCEIAIGIIQKNKDKNIVLVGDDLLSIRQIAKFCNFKNVFVMEDFRNSNQLSNMELFFYDVIFMSYAKILYGTNSAVVRLANYIGNQKFINNYSVFNEKELYDIIKENIEKFNTSNSQKAFSYFHLFIVSKKINISKENLIEFLEKALEYDYENDKYRIHLIDVLLNHNEFSKANEMLKTILLTRESEYLKTLFLKGWIGVVYSNLFDIYLKSSCLQYPYIAYVAMHILKFRVNLQIQTSNNTLNNTIKEKDSIIKSNITQLNQIQSKLSFQTKYGTAKTRIQNQLSYKLGQAMIVNSKSFLGYLIMPMALLSIMISHKQEQKVYQEKIKKVPSLKLPILEDYPDYKEALKLKNHLSYKLGQALIQANKTWYKGGYVKMWFEIRKLKRRELWQ